MGKRVLTFVLLLSVIGALSANATPMLVSEPTIIEWIGTDTPQPDTILYDDPLVGSYRLYGGTFYCSVRFTPLLNFDLRAAYIGLSVQVADTISIWVAGDNGGFADPSNIYEQLVGYLPANGWNQVDFADTHSFNANVDFHIVYGPLPSTEHPDSLRGMYPLLDSNADNLDRSYYNSTWPTSGPTAPVYGYDWRCRAGGEYESGGWVDLGITNVDNQQVQYFFCQNDVATFQALVGNVGTLDVTTYTVEWVVQDETPTTVFTTTGTYGALLAGNDTTVVAPTNWTASALGEFICTATVTATGDAIPENNSSMLEQQVDDPTLAHLLDYDIPDFQVNLSLGPNNGRAMEFTPCSYPVEITQMQMEITSAGDTARLVIYGDDGLDAPDPSNILFDTTTALVTGNNVFNISPAIPIASGSFYLAYIATSSNTPTIPMDAAPCAGENLTMGVMYETANNGASWVSDLGGDHPLRAMVIPFGGTIRDIAVDWMTFPGFFGPGSDPFEGQIQVTNNGTDADTFNVSLTIEDTTFARSVVFYESQTVTNLAVGDSAMLTYGTYSFPSIGEYILTAEAVVPGDANPGDNILKAEHQTCSYPSELTYDDGTFENGWAYYDPGNWWGARFDPPIYPCKITGMRLNFSTVPTGYDNAKAQIIGPDGTSLWYDYEDPAVVVGWNTYSPGDILVLSSFFYAGTEWVTGAPDAPYFSTDTNKPISYMARQRIAGVWYYDVEEAGVRVTVDAAVMSPIVIQRTGGSRNLDMQLSWTFAGTTGETYYFIYESNAPYGTYTLAGSVIHPVQTWSETNMPEVKKFYYVTFGDSSGSRASTLPGQYLWQPFEMTVSGNSAFEPGVIRAPRNAADHR